MANAAVHLYPANDFALTVKLQDIDPLTGVKSALTSGTVTAFISATLGPTATAADPSLSVVCTHLSGGKWLIFFDASVLTAALLASLFGAATPYLYVVYPSGVRAYLTLTYTPNREGVLA